MPPTILRDPDEVQKFILQSLCLQRTIQPAAATVRTILDWAMEIASSGQLLPPVGFVADVGHVAFGSDRDHRQPKDPTPIPGIPPGLLRTYEDHVLGRIYADWTFERASDAMRRYAGRDRVRGLAYVVKQIRERGQFDGVELPPGILRTLAEVPGEELLRRGRESLEQNGLMPLLKTMYDSLIGAARRMAEVLDPADVIALEQGTALADMGQYVAHRQVLQISARLEAALPRQKVKPLAGRQEVPTRVLDEDTYPVGGFTSISNRGSIESLLHSQLAYMERDEALRPDLFDIKFLRDELYYYSRDENQFLRRRRTFLFALYPDLVLARFKDNDIPCQRIVLILSLLLSSVRKLSEWLSTDALKFEFLFVTQGEAKPLLQEASLLEMLFREQIENGIVSIEHVPEKEVAARCVERARRNLVHCLPMSVREVEVVAAGAIATAFCVNSSRPVISRPRQEMLPLEGDEPLDTWSATLEYLLMLWV